jgi:hypothetical protein
MLCLSAAMLWGGAPQRDVMPLITDAKGVMVGVALGHVEEAVQVVMILGGVPTTLAVIPMGIRGEQKRTTSVFWESADCTGVALLPVDPYDSGFGGIALSSATTLYVPVIGPSAVHTAHSLFDFVFEEMGCQTAQVTRPFIEALTFPLSIFDVFTRPFTITGARSLP